MQPNQIKNVKIIDGNCRIADAQVVRVGSWRNLALADANDMRDDLPRYIRTVVVTLNVVHKDNVDVLRKLKAAGDDIRRAFITCQIHINEGDESRTPIDGEVLKEATIREVMDENGDRPLLHGEKSALEGRPVHQGHIVDYYPPAKVDDISLDDLLGSADAFEEKKQPISSEEGETVDIDDLNFDGDDEGEQPQPTAEEVQAFLDAQKAAKDKN